MTFMLALDGLTDAELVDRITSGDPRAAARFWVRHWPTALTAARGLVEPAEVPGLAAEALVGALASIRVGGGPSDHAAVFVIDAVHELGGDEFSGSNLSSVKYPDLFPSSTLAAAFAALRIEDQQLLWAAFADGVPDDELAISFGVTAAEVAERRDVLLGTLQQSFVDRHTEYAGAPECQETHRLLAAAVADPGTRFPHETWEHLSECVICTEAFHELAHTPSDLGPLLGAASFPGPVPAEAGSLSFGADAVAPAAELAEEPAPEPAPLFVEDAVAEEAVVADAAVLDAPAAEPEPVHQTVPLEEPGLAAEPDEDSFAEDETTEVAALLAEDPFADGVEEQPTEDSSWSIFDAAIDPVAEAAHGLDGDFAAGPPVTYGAPVVPLDGHVATSHASERRRTKPLYFILGAAALAGVFALGVSMLSGGSSTPRPAAEQAPTSTPSSPEPSATPTDPTTPSDSPTVSASAPKPSTFTATAAADSTAKATDSPSEKPSAKPTKSTPSPSKAPTSKPSPTQTPTTPTPSPTPTKPCGILGGLLGSC